MFPWLRGGHLICFFIKGQFSWTIRKKNWKKREQIWWYCFSSKRLKVRENKENNFLRAITYKLTDYAETNDQFIQNSVPLFWDSSDPLFVNCYTYFTALLTLLKIRNLLYSFLNPPPISPSPIGSVIFSDK